MRSLMEPLRGRSFRLYWVGQTTSAYGDQVFLVALALQVLLLGGGARELGLVNAAAGTALVLFLLAIGRAGTLPRPPVPEAPRRLLGDLREGVREVMRHRWLWVTILLFTFIVLLVVGPEEVLVPVYLQQRFQAAEAFGLVVACAGVGAVAGALLTGIVRPVRRGLWAYAGGLVAALALAGYAAAAEVWQLALLAVAWGAGIESFQVVWDTSLQELVPPEALGRWSSLDAVGSLALLPVSFALVGVVADGIGARPVFALAGLGAAALMCVGFLVPGVRDYRAPPQPGGEPAGVPIVAGDRNDAR